jgi:hypothetical protein
MGVTVRSRQDTEAVEGGMCEEQAVHPTVGPMVLKQPSVRAQDVGVLAKVGVHVVVDEPFLGVRSGDLDDGPPYGGIRTRGPVSSASWPDLTITHP